MGTNSFATLPTISPNASGAQSVVDLFEAVPHNGLDPDLTFICTGGFIGSVSVEGSPDGTAWVVLAQFTSGLNSTRNRPPTLEFSPQVVADASVRYLRAFVRANVLEDTQISVAGQRNTACACSNQPDLALDLGRFYVVDYLHGDDSRIGYIDAPLDSEFEPEDLEALAVKTIEEISLRIPRQGAGHRAIVLVRGDPDASSPIEYFRKDGVTRDWIDRSGYSGYITMIWRASDFTNSALDQLHCPAMIALAGPNDDDSWTVDSYSAPVITVASGSLPASLSAEGYFCDWEGNNTAALATRAGQVKRVRSSSTVEVSIGSRATSAAPINGDRFKIKRPSVLIACDVGSDENQTTPQSNSELVTRPINGTVIAGFQYGGWSPAIPGGLSYMNRVDGVAYARTYWTGFIAIQLSSSEGYRFNGVYLNPAGLLVDCGCSAAFVRSNTGQGVSVTFNGKVSEIVGTPGGISNLVIWGNVYGWITLQGNIGAYTQTFYALASSAIYGVLFLANVKAAWGLLSGADIGDNCIGGYSTATRMLLQGTAGFAQAIQVNSGTFATLNQILMVGGTVDAIGFIGSGSLLRLKSVTRESGTFSGYGVNFLGNASNSFNQLIDAGGNDVAGTLGAINFDFDTIKTWAEITQGFISSNSSELLREGQTVAALRKVTANTLANLPILGADPVDPKDGDLWATNIAGVKSLCLQVDGATVRAIFS